MISDPAGPGKTVYVVLSLETPRQVPGEQRTGRQGTLRAGQRSWHSARPGTAAAGRSRRHLLRVAARRPARTCRRARRRRHRTAWPPASSPVTLSRAGACCATGWWSSMTPGRCSPTGLSSSLTSGCACPVALAARKRGTPGRLLPCRLVVPVKEGCASEARPWLAQPSLPRRPVRHLACGSMPRGCTRGGYQLRPSRRLAAFRRRWPQMHGDRLAHSPACRRHLATADCPVDCLAPLLGSRVLGRLARADGRRGEPVASCGTPATVGDVVRLYRQGRLGEIGGLGPLSIREIGLALVSCGLVAAEDGDAITPDCPVDCLRSRDLGPGAEPARPRGRPRSAGSAQRAASHGRRCGPPVPRGAGSARSRAWVLAASARSRPAWSSPGSSSTAAPRCGSSRVLGPRHRVWPPSRPAPGSPLHRAAGGGGPARAAAEPGRHPGHAR